MILPQSVEVWNEGEKEQNKTKQKHFFLEKHVHDIISGDQLGTTE